MAVTYLCSTRAASAALRTRLSSRLRLSRSGLANPGHPFLRPPCPRRRPQPSGAILARGVPLVQENGELPFISNRLIADSALGSMLLGMVPLGGPSSFSHHG